MKLLICFLETLAVIIALGLWGLIPDMLWDYGYKLGAMAAFLIIPFGLFFIAQSYGDWRRNWLNHGQRRSFNK